MIFSLLFSVIPLGWAASDTTKSTRLGVSGLLCLTLGAVGLTDSESPWDTLPSAPHPGNLETAGQLVSDSEQTAMWNRLLALCSGRVLGEVRGKAKVLMPVSDAEVLGGPEGARGGLPSGMHWGGLGVSTGVLLGSRSAMWSRCDTALESIVWEAWGETKVFLWSVPLALTELATGASGPPLPLLLSLLSLGPHLGF